VGIVLTTDSVGGMGKFLEGKGVGNCMLISVCVSVIGRRLGREGL